jgi:hypothetical protein
MTYSFRLLQTFPNFQIIECKSVTSVNSPDAQNTALPLKELLRAYESCTTEGIPQLASGKAVARLVFGEREHCSRVDRDP